MNEFPWEPRSGIIADYVETFSPTTDAPRQFHVFVCLVLMAAVLGRRVWVQDGAQRLYPNLYVLLLAPSSLYRKSTCIAIGRALARDLEAAEAGGATTHPLLYPGQFTPESLLDILEAQPTGLLEIDEWRQFSDSMRRDYNSGLREMFLSLYDCRGVHRKIRSGEKRIEAPAMNILSACATPWFVEAVGGGEIRSGFYPRLCMVPAWQKSRHMARGQAPHRTNRYNVLKQLAGLRNVAGEMHLPPRLEEVFGEWALGQQKAILGSDHEAEIAGFITRLERVCLKLATLIELSRAPESLEISVLSLQDALSLTGWLQTNVRRLFEKEFSFDAGDALRRKLLNAIEKNPGIQRRDLMRKSHLGVRDFDPAISTLVQTEQIHQRDGGFFAGVSPGSRSVTSLPVTPNMPSSIGDFR